jgi:RNA recognition motif-containing protein
MNIYVSSLSFSTKSEKLQELFEQFGEVSSANIITDRETGRSRGFGFVEMPDDAQAKAAIDALNNTEFEGRTIIVNEARPKTEREDRGGFNRGGGGFNRNRY